MCLIKVRKEEEEETYVPVRVHRVERDTLRVASPHHHHSPHRRSSARISRTSIRHSNPAVIEVPSPPVLAVPPPQPVPVFVQPPPAPPPPPLAPEVHYVHVSPPSHSSRSSSPHSHYDHHYERREIREYRDSSPARSHRGREYYDYRYVDAEPEGRTQYRLRSRSSSRSRGGDIRDYIDEPERRRSTKVKVIHVDDDGNRRRSTSRGRYYD